MATTKASESIQNITRQTRYQPLCQGPDSQSGGAGSEKYRMLRHVRLQTEETVLILELDECSVAREARMDGICFVRVRNMCALKKWVNGSWWKPINR